jgi:hypothetical protein
VAAAVPSIGTPIDAHQAGDVFDLLFAQILEREVKLIAHLVAYDAANTDPAGLGQCLETGGDVDAVTVDVALIDDNIAEINADAEVDAPFSGNVSVVALCHVALHLDRAAHRIDDAGKLDQRAVAGGFDKAATVLPDLWVDQFALQCL